mmetsp:Transcript_22403/g.46587  ORF Transcript_22403/g.46587 Transcript_22403/m.46587 type:complete len:433 (+) Transcript_22403:110-1408(+)
MSSFESADHPSSQTLNPTPSDNTSSLPVSLPPKLRQLNNPRGHIGVGRIVTTQRDINGDPDNASTESDPVSPHLSLIDYQQTSSLVEEHQAQNVDGRMEVETDVGKGGGEQINESAATATSRSTAELSDADIIDTIISSLLSLTALPPGSQCPLPVSHIHTLLNLSSRVLSNSPSLVRLEPGLKICGDIHGQYTDLLRLLEYGSHPPDERYLFLGDYVDRGKQGVETICLLLAYKVKYGDTITLLRGNHEASGINRIYGFYDELKRRYSVSLWKKFNSVFALLPVAALVGGRVLCMHGGISESMLTNGLEGIEAIERPCEVGDVGLLCDLLWSDPSRLPGFTFNERGVSHCFGPDVLALFLERFDLDLVVRAHQVVEDGYEFFAGRRLVTVFSAPSYCGEFDNAGGMMSVGEDMVCSFQILKPSSREERFGR